MEKSMTKEEIVTTIRGLAEKLGRVPSLAELKTMTAVGRRAVRNEFTTYTNALIACGMTTNRKQRIEMAALFEDWATVARKLGKLPSSMAYEENGRHSAKAILARCGSWKRVPHMMLEYAREQGLEKKWPDVAAMARAEKELSWPAKESLWPGFEASRWDVFTNRPVYGTPIHQGPLAHTPTNEMGVVYLFGAMARELGYVVTLLQAEFPACEALRQVKQDRWQRVRIEFEYESRNFVQHGHDTKGCDMIVCWSHNWEGCPVEVVELKKEIAKIAGSTRSGN
jgi:Homing endonuclease associated repeat